MNCCVCGGDAFTHGKILWDGLVDEWEIDEFEREYINRQQGSRCDHCGCNFRSLALSKAVMDHWGFRGLFQNFVKKHRNLRVLEINEASDLTKWLKDKSHRVLAEYPAVDMQSMHAGKGLQAISTRHETFSRRKKSCAAIGLRTGRATVPAHSDLSACHPSIPYGKQQAPVHHSA